ncbi:MAG TPA: exo-beta-N-acetylmuramidase NamZ domain-containing protein, partial [Gillisia sp.]|nr:exo-beta-N-acetylmuramidase NamZ domain-containing protein [Gillisia sp.]
MPKYILLLITVIFVGSPLYSQEIEEIGILSREEWKAQPAGEGLKWHIPRFITIHHTGTNQNSKRTPAEKLQALQKFSYSEGILGDGITPKKPWPDVPYHYYITVDGIVVEGRKIQYQGDSNTDYYLNGHALIVVEGNFEKEKIKDPQYQKLEQLVITLAKKYKVSAEEITGHKDQAQTTCPGEDLYKLLPKLREKVKTLENPRVIIGAEQIFSPQYEQLLKGKRIGLITNHTGLLPDGTHLIDLLNDHKDVDLTLLFGPEHGLRGEEDTHVSDGVDKKTGLPIISLYGKLRKPTKEM